MNTALVYDIEILKAILGRDEVRQPDVEYCDGWHDHANMGISVIGAYDYFEDRYRAFCGDNIDAFFDLAARRQPLVSFNGIGFDDKVLSHEVGAFDCFLPSAPRYDLLREIWIASGLAPEYDGDSHKGFGLDATCEANFGIRKTGNGAHAALLWQRRRIGEVIDYCLNDVRLTKRLFDAVLRNDPIICPKTGGILSLRQLVA
jgi:hypothetical protein